VVVAVSNSLLGSSCGQHGRSPPTRRWSRSKAPREEIERIDYAVSQIPVPLGFSEEHYNLRSAINLVRERNRALATRVHPNLT